MNYSTKHPNPPPFVRARLAWEQGYLLTALEQHNGCVSAAARAIGMDRTHMHVRLRALRELGVRP